MAAKYYGYVTVLYFLSFFAGYCKDMNLERMCIFEPGDINNYANLTSQDHTCTFMQQMFKAKKS